MRNWPDFARMLVATTVLHVPVSPTVHDGGPACKCPQTGSVPRSEHAKTISPAPSHQRGADSPPDSVKFLNAGKSNDDAMRQARQLAAGERIAASNLYWTEALGVATIVLAAASLGTLWITRKTARAQLRAYLGISFRWNDGMVDRNMNLWCDLANRCYQTAIFVSDHGQTPAHDIRFHGRCEVLSVAGAEETIRATLVKPNGEDYDAPRLCDPRGGEGLPLFYYVSGGKGTMRIPADSDRIYAYGVIQYLDIFNDKHTATFCAFCDPLSPSGSVWRTAPYFNTVT